MSNKKSIIKQFSNHVSSGKASFFRKYGMDFVMGDRSGGWLHDLDGEKVLYNLHCNGGVFNLGHRNQEIIQTLTDALQKVDIGNHHLMSQHRASLADQFSKLTPDGLDYTVFSVGGGEAIEVAIKIAKGYTGKDKIISAIGGYHGHTGLALATGDEKYRAPFRVPTASNIQCEFGNIDSLKNAVDANTAAVILETIPATLGIIIPTKEYLKEVEALCREKGILFILDEVQSGLGRTGKLWAFEHFNVVPDILVVGKGLSGGIYPIAATVFNKKLESVFHPDPFIHISTFGGAEPGCFVASKVLEISSEPDFLQHVSEMSTVFEIEIDKLKAKHPKFIKGLNRLGLMMGLEMFDDYAGPILTKTAYDNGILLIYANNDTRICQLLPPLTINETEIKEVIHKLDQAIIAAQKLLPLVKIKNSITSIFSPFKLKK